MVHVLHKVKKWCREGRSDVVILPLEAALAQRARAASRIVEQAGANLASECSRVDALVLWDHIPFSKTASGASPAPAPASSSSLLKTNQADAPAMPRQSGYVRRTIRVRWGSTLLPPPPLTRARVRLAVLPSAAPPTSSADGALTKHEPRAAGTLVSAWAARAGIDLLTVAASSGAPNGAAGTTGSGASASAAVPRRPRAGTQTKRGGGAGSIRGESGGGLVERPQWRAVRASSACSRAGSASTPGRDHRAHFYVALRGLPVGLPPPPTSLSTDRPTEDYFRPHEEEIHRGIEACVHPGHDTNPDNDAHWRKICVAPVSCLT
ncbi:hypothetical protein B0H15DRAFT_954595 [Mycena belliarum]|uniref:Uncharacterized protein n=1 Tax=Mycena belliarum TaxID=1033014 RepID=A0AAD6XKZ8_9AGAR|nr:hypothetical protein B0H15DRAFT_954595 [Mycena belliae]